jgi:AraC family transcriptional regulator
MKKAAGSRVPDELARVLVHIQSHLDGDLSLRALAGVSHASPYHFHRTFRAIVGETAKEYVQRVRLERAAIRLLLHKDAVVGIAFDSGFRSHETFCRAFKKRFRVSPRTFRHRTRRTRPEDGPPDARSLDESGGAYSLSKTKIVEMSETHLVCLRHVGPYSEVPPGLWDRLVAWAGRSGVPGPRVLFGIAHDAPGITAPRRLRFDAAVRVPGPLQLKGDFACQTLPSGTYALSTHLGHFRTLGRAYRAIVARLHRLPGYDILGLPTVEVYRSTRINTECELNETDIYIPLRRRVETTTTPRRNAR